MRLPAPSRGDFAFFAEHPTRWSDNDMFNHINNVLYYRFFEATILAFYAKAGVGDWTQAPIIPVVAESLCRFRSPLSFPEVIDAGLRVEQLGTSSVRFGLGLFRRGEEGAAADGHWVHVFTERASGQACPIPDEVRKAFLEAKTPSP